MTRTTFVNLYPAFSPTDPDVVDAFLAEVLLGLDPNVYGNRLDAAHGALTAHELWKSPAGTSLRSETADLDTSDYLRKFQRIRREVTTPFAVLR